MAAAAARVATAIRSRSAGGGQEVLKPGNAASGSLVAKWEGNLLMEGSMIWTIFVILLVLWLLGIVTGTTLGGFVHLLLLIALVVVIIRVISGRRAV
jgi:hypothetical protein